MHLNSQNVVDLVGWKNVEKNETKMARFFVAFTLIQQFGLAGG